MGDDKFAIGVLVGMCLGIIFVSILLGDKLISYG